MLSEAHLVSLKKEVKNILDNEQGKIISQVVDKFIEKIKRQFQEHPLTEEEKRKVLVSQDAEQVLASENIGQVRAHLKALTWKQEEIIKDMDKLFEQLLSIEYALAYSAIKERLFQEELHAKPSE